VQLHDLSHDGAIDHRELRLLARELGVEMSVDEAKMAVAALDVDGNTSLSYEEFLPWWMAFLVKNKQRAKRQVHLSADRVAQLQLRAPGARREGRAADGGAAEPDARGGGAAIRGAAAAARGHARQDHIGESESGEECARR
jgi:hypothetical protein